MGGQAKARWKYSFVMYDGKKFHDLEWEEPVIFRDSPHLPITKGYPLNNITLIGKDEQGNEVMLSDLSEEERSNAEYAELMHDNNKSKEKDKIN